ncbi:DUF6708 domain-containing protein [Providencia rettgeri]|uniref:DUF6708 domain-containing protein n=1 Tax=Providencia rettgeri TaxID=587 RepID=UPI001B39C708|nr:DUF6708 domain-containing protein [Providencia rettgeri]EHZ7763695.1 hypothetical protein [Providencia rettgeri]EIJ7166837.1 hypothetical protein [Providencia rettgeri]EJD6046890.1 hypothetical protein [Providencia rettgeri]ELM3938336.1 hypothetical protein [Providencia rettgeri]ELR5091579.1 hypothetical protein [Providencia rettgeri]
MDIYGLHPKFKLNRPLTNKEREGHLDQNRRLELTQEEVIPDLTVIQINSHYLELVDKFYSGRGYMSFLSLCCSLACFGGVLWLIIQTFLLSDYSFIRILAILFVSLILLPLSGFMVYLLKTEWFAWTHYPIRFDRKNQLVHIHRTDGSVFTVPWQDIFFTTGLNYQKSIRNDYYISGHILADDGITIIDTFCLPLSHPKLHAVMSHWEFVRRYMEEGPQDLIQQIDFCLPIDKKKERYSFTFFYLMSLYKGAPILLFPLFIPLAFIFSIPRYIGILTSRRPVWPESIQAQCPIDKDDPYRLDATSNPKNLWRTFF